jgi:hypothetical protein
MEVKQMKFAKFVFGVVVFALICITNAVAQENAAITGTVTDSSNAVISNVTVTLTNELTGEARTTTTNSAGLYNFAQLNHGKYDVKVEAQGFNGFDKKDVIVNVAAVTQVNAILNVGSAAQTVTVEADALGVQTETNEVSNLITGEQISQLATNGRNVVSLTTLGTGVSNNLASFNGVTAQGSGFGLSFNGMRPDHNDWLIDGGEAYDRGSGGKFDLMPSPDALAEFQALSSNYSPDYGISSGGTITMVIKSGGKSYHGGLWEFNRNDAYDANYYFAKQQNIPPPELRLNIFGGNFGGPVFIPGLYPKERSKTFFFVNEEWRRFIQGVNPSPTNTVPTTDFPVAGAPLAYQPWNEVKASQLGPNVCNGAPPCVPQTNDPAKLALYHADGLTPGDPFPGNVIPANLIDQNAVLFMGAGTIPKPNSGSATLPQYTASPKQPTNVREDTVRIDHDLSSRMHLMGHWIHDQMSQTIIPTMWSGDSYDTVGDVFQNPSWSAVIQLTQTLTPNLLNETALDVNGNTINITPIGTGGASITQPAGWNAGSFFQGNNALNRLPQVGFGAPLNTTWTTNYWPWHNAYLNYQIRDDLAWTTGKHQFKFGFSYMRSDKNQQLQTDTQGDYSFGTDFSGDSYLNFLLGVADSYAQLQSLTTDHWLNNTYSVFGMDNWHILPRLTLNIGARYDILPHAYEKNNRVSNFVSSNYNYAQAAVLDPNSGAVCTAAGTGCSAVSPGIQTVDGGTFYMNGIQLAGQGGFPRGIVQNQYVTIQPRVGFAWDVYGTGKTVLRGGGGMFYERIQGNDIFGAANNPPFAYHPSANSVYFSNPTTNAKTGGTAGTSTFPASLQNLRNYYPNPATAQFSLGIQQQLAPSVIAVIQYVGSAGWNQSDQRNINTLPLSDLTDRAAVAGGANANLYRIFPGYAGITQVESATNQDYNSLQAGLRMDNKHGLTTQLSYTWSHEIDIQSGDLGSTNIAGSGGSVSDPFNLKYDRGSGAIDRRHIFSVNYDYKMPWFLHDSNVLQHTLLGGWEVSGVTVAQSGTPINVTYSPDTVGLGGGTNNRPDKTAAKVNLTKKQTQWFDTGAFAAPAAAWAGSNSQGFGTSGKDAVVGPGLFNWNISLFKSFPISKNENPRFELRFESFNTFNHTQFNGVDSGFTDGNFGQVTSTYDPRVLQFGGKFLF